MSQKSIEEDIALSFRGLTVTSTTSASPLLYNVSGYVKRSGITAVMGPSASGKSLLMQTLSGRVQDLALTGDVIINNQLINPKRLDNPVAYVPQEDSLIGELTAREMTTNTAVFKKNEPLMEIQVEVNDLLENLGLAKVADGIIGTMIFRGLSGGQKKRVEISTELIASPAVLLIDEPTSGLDSSIAFEVLSTVRELVVKKSEGKLSVILSIHQPNSKILELFDHLLLLDKGTAYFFGTLPEASTLWLNLQPTTENISDYASAAFFIALCGMLLVISATALYAKDRFEAVDRVSNGVFSPGIFVTAQFLVSAAYDFVVALLKNDFLACTSAMVYIGSNMAFAGFFRPVAEMPRWIFWVAYIAPLRWGFQGFIWQIFYNQSFTVSNISPTMTVSGTTILSNVFQLDDVNSWGMFGVMLLYIISLRVCQYVLFARETGTFPSFGFQRNVSVGNKELPSNDLAAAPVENGVEIVLVN